MICEAKALQKLHVFLRGEFLAVMASELDFPELVFLYRELCHHSFRIRDVFRVETFHDALNVVRDFNGVFVDDFEIFDFNE